MKILFYSVLLHALCIAACCCQCVPSVDNGELCLTCDSVSYKCDTILPLNHGGFVIRIHEKWFHATAMNLVYLLSSSETRSPHTDQYSHYLHLKVGREDAWFDAANKYEVMPFRNMSVPDVPACMFGLIRSSWSIVAPDDSTRNVQCDLLVDATWNNAIVENNGRRSLVRLEDSVMLLNDLGEAQFVGTEAVLYRLKSDTSRSYWRLYHLQSGVISTLRYDTVRVFDALIVGSTTDHDVLLDSRGVIQFETTSKEYIRECNDHRLEIYKDGGREAYLSDLDGTRLNTIAFESIWLGSGPYYISFEKQEKSFCVMNDNGKVIVPSKLYYPIRTSWARVLYGITESGILLAENASGSLVYLQITSSGYRELHCGQH